MWMLVMFDLPVVTKQERRQYTKFRHFLLDEGFEMSQFSVYMRLCRGKEQVEARTRRIERNLPSAGKVHILSITDKQFENIVTFHRRRRGAPKNPDQLALF
jgi:CRISPR-associated protein Cas2